MVKELSAKQVLRITSLLELLLAALSSWLHLYDMVVIALLMGAVLFYWSCLPEDNNEH